MAMPADINARRYYRVAYQRLDDGTALLDISRPRAAIYLTGYAVECILKALLLMSTPAGERAEVLATFRGEGAHNIDWLRGQLIRRIGQLPIVEARHVSLVSSWSTDLRYEPGPGDPEDARGFLTAADSILRWANGRMWTMATIVRNDVDESVQALKDALDAYEIAHPGAEAALYRHNPGSVRVRVIDRRFEGMTKTRRHADVWEFLAAHVPEDVLADVSLVLSVAPAELETSFANFEFESPIPSKL